MGNVARLGVFCLMGLAIALSRLIEVELSPPEPIELRAEAPSAAATGDAQPAQPSQPQPAQPAQPNSARPQPKQGPAGRTYTVQSGDSLGRISQKVYGTSRHWRKILEANRDAIPDERRMRAGVELRIPPVEARRP